VLTHHRQLRPTNSVLAAALLALAVTTISPAHAGLAFTPAEGAAPTPAAVPAAATPLPAPAPAPAPAPEPAAAAATVESNATTDSIVTIRDKETGQPLPTEAALPTEAVIPIEAALPNAAAAPAVSPSNPAPDIGANPEPVERMGASDGQRVRSVALIEDFEDLKLRWENSFGGNRPDVFRGVTSRRSDMATVAVGHTMSDSSGRKDAWVVAINDDGALIWQRAIGGARDDSASDIVDLEDGDLIVVGDTSTGASGKVDGLIVRLSAQGEVQWQRSITGEGDIFLNAVISSSSDRLLVAGSAGTAGYIAEIDTQGNVIWEQRLVDEGPDVITAIDTLPNGQIIVVGKRSEMFDSNAAAANLSSNGEVLWSRSYGGDDRDAFHDVIVLLDGTALAVGETYVAGAAEQGWLVKLALDENDSWSKLFGGPGLDRLTGISVLSDQTLALVGHTDANNEAAENSWILRVNAAGDLIKARALGAEYSDGLAKIAARADGSFATVGFRNSDFDTARDAYVALLGMPSSVSTEPVFRGDNPPTLFVPGGGELFTENASVEIVGNVLHNRPVKALWVDGKPTEILPNGAFIQHISVAMGRRSIKIEAVDDRNIIGSTEVSVVRAKGAVTPPPIEELIENIAFGDYHAVVIGNDAYSNDLPALRTAVKDAEAVANVLNKEYGFDVNLLLNASRSEIVEALQEKKRSLSTDDNLLVYYAGHGYYDEDTDSGYWLPVDAQLDSQDKWISNSEIRESIKGMSAKHVLLVADSCFSGTLLRNVDVQRSGKFYEQMANRSARLVMTSGGVEPVMDGGGDGHSVFARSFLRKLSSPDQIIDGTSLFQSVREPVVMTSDQVPQYSNIRFIDSDGGDFLFVKKSSLAAR
jgi:hypothetical protein